MDVKRFLKSSNIAFMLKNLLIAGVIFLLLAWLVLYFTDKYTNHGEFEVVPELKGLSVEEAAVILSEKGLYPQIIDSVYMRDKELGSIVEQVPNPAATIKRKRPVYLIINSRELRKIPIPDVYDVSYRQAEAMLKAVGLDVGNVEYIPSEYKNLVTDIKYRDKSIHPGTRLPEGEKIVLVVGRGLGEQAVDVPSLRGLNLESARIEILRANMAMGAINYDIPPTGNESEYIIYRQRPAVGNTAQLGSRVDIWLSTDISLLEKEFIDEERIRENDEEFF
jgi:beta-lactam-binding protein with PASTA domain